MNFKFSNLLGAPYRGGNLILYADTLLLSPVGNRVHVINLSTSESRTLSFETANDIAFLALSPDGRLLVAVDETGRAKLVNPKLGSVSGTGSGSVLDALTSQSFLLDGESVILHHFKFKSPVSALRFSPDGKFLAAAVGKLVQIWHTPSWAKTFTPMRLHKTYAACHDKVTCLDWSPDGRWIAAGSKDLTARIFSFHSLKAYRPVILAGHRDVLVSVFFHPFRSPGEKVPEYTTLGSPKAENEQTFRKTVQYGLYTVARDGALFVWKFDPVKRKAKKWDRLKAGKRSRVEVREPGEKEREAEREGGDGEEGGLTKGERDEEEREEGAGGDVGEEEREGEKAGEGKGDASEGEEEEEKKDEDDEQEQNEEDEEEGEESDKEEEGGEDERERVEYISEDPRVSIRLDEGRWHLLSKSLFMQSGAALSSCDFHPSLSLLLAGFSSGVFGLYQLHSPLSPSPELSRLSLPFDGGEEGDAGEKVRGKKGGKREVQRDFSTLQLLSVSREKISAVAFGGKGDWLCIGCAALGQLLVWEWRSETYIWKQQGHKMDVNCLSFSPDGSLIVTGGKDGKLKVWNAGSGTCFVTLVDHTLPVTGVEFLPNGNAVVSASLDGTVRAFDLIRYRNFRTFTSPEPTQFAALAVHSSGDIICASSQENFQIFVWSLKTGRLLDIISGHTSPVHGLAFSPTQETLASCSWDRTVRLWSLFASGEERESFSHSHDVLALAYRPDGKQVAAASLDGQIQLWNVLEGEMEGVIEGRRDIAGGRLVTDRQSANNSSQGKCFTSLCYSPDGAFLLAVGTSRYVCCYDVAEKVLLRRFELSSNRSLDGILDHLSNRKMTDAGNLDLIRMSEGWERDQEEDGETAEYRSKYRGFDPLDDEAEEGGDGRNRVQVRSNNFGKAGAGEGENGANKSWSVGSMPGANLNKGRPVIKATSVRMCPTGRSFAVASSEGVIMFSLNEGMGFDPSDLEEEVTPEAALRALQEKRFTLSLLLSLRLNHPALIRRVIDSVPFSEISLVVKNIPKQRLTLVIATLANQIERNPKLQFLLQWARSLLFTHGNFLQTHRDRSLLLPPLVSLLKSLNRMHSDLSEVCSNNNFMLQYLTRSNTKNGSSNGSKGGSLYPDAFGMTELQVDRADDSDGVVAGEEREEEEKDEAE